MSVNLFCHGRAEWAYTVLALRGRFNYHLNGIYLISEKRKDHVIEVKAKNQ